MPSSREERIREQTLLLTGEPIDGAPIVWSDMSNYMSIERGHVVEIEGELYLVRGNEHEGRFGIDEQPKFWVKHALDLGSGRPYILKLSCQEAFRIHIGQQEIRCTRSSAKEAKVLEAVRGDNRFMQGRAARDARGNSVHIIEFIPGVDLLTYLFSLPVNHERYFHTALPGILEKVAGSLSGIQYLHDRDLCHGDIRNDHLLVERATGSYRWIDFDLSADFRCFDVWSAGNILHCVAAKGFVTFHDAMQAQPRLAGELWREDASVFFPSRVMNLQKVFPYIPECLNAVLCRFSIGSRARYDRISQITDDLADCAAGMGWNWNCRS